MNEHERRQAAYGEQVRAKYTAAEIKALGAKGQAFKNPDGSYSYPIVDTDDLSNAIHAVGRGNSDHDAIRKYIIGRAKALGKSSEIPDNWGSDGSLKASNSAEIGGEDRDQPTSEDWTVSYGLKNAKQALAGVKADQLADPDNKTDPDDEDVMSAIEEAEAAIDKAIVAQGKDGQYEKKSAATIAEAREMAGLPPANFASAKRAFSSLVERAPERVTEMQIRLDGGENPNIAHFDGYAYTIDQRYDVTDWLGTYREAIGPGASSKTLKEQRAIPLLLNHDGLPMANTQSKTSQLADDGHGLRNQALFDRRSGLTNDVCIALERGDVNKMSFSFRAVVDAWNDAYDDRYVRELQLYDTSIVTYPANPTTSAELVDGMRSAMGREGRSLWLAEGEMSVRSALPLLSQPDRLDTETEDLLERAVRALVGADEVLCRSHGPHGRARTFHVASAMLELRAGKTLSAKNQALLQSAADALASADKQHAKAAKQHAAATEALNTVLGSGQEGMDGNQGAATGGNPINPQDGAGPRSARALRLKREREAELRAMRRH